MLEPIKPVKLQGGLTPEEIAKLEAVAYMANHTVNDVPAILAAQEALARAGMARAS